MLLLHRPCQALFLPYLMSCLAIAGITFQLLCDVFATAISLSIIRRLLRWSLKRSNMSTSVRCETGGNTSDSPITPQQTNRDDDEREATELGPVQHGLSDTVVNPASIGATSASNVAETTPILGGVRSWWKHYIQLHVPHAECRDHLGMSDFDPIFVTDSRMWKAEQAQLTFATNAANERTFLAYQRTSLALSMLGIVTAQLFSLQRSVDPAHDPIFGYHTLGKPLAGLFQSAAIVVILIGGHRFWRQQMNMARGRVWAGGWEIWSIMGFMLLVSFLSLFPSDPFQESPSRTDISSCVAVTCVCVWSLDRL
jgi:uncharacterized membrane protein YidH (DUF202 family)